VLRACAITASASSVSPRPSSCAPSVAPTPRKLKRNVDAPASPNARATRGHDLVVHGAAIERMGMAHDRDRAGRRVRGDRHLDASRAALDEDALRDGPSDLEPLDGSARSPGARR
jgi:hypothetical protein